MAVVGAGAAIKEGGTALVRGLTGVGHLDADSVIINEVNKKINE